MELFDLIVIGGGPGGYLCAERAAQGGMKTVLFEERALGGACLNEGCVPTKTLLNSAKLYRHAVEGAAFGVIAEKAVLDHAKVVERKDKVVKTLASGIKGAMKSCNVAVVDKKAVVEGRTEGGFAVKAGGKSYAAKRLVVATGSETAAPPIPGLKDGIASGFVATNREVLDRKELPDSLVVIGGGVIGLEMACYFSAAGVHVTVIEMAPKIAGPTDPDICKVLIDEYSRRGVEFKLSCKVLEVARGSVLYEEAGEQKEVKCGLVLLSAGRKPFTRGLGLEKLGLEMDGAAIATDKHLCTNVAGVYAVGDCNGKLMLAHTAYREAEVAVNHMLGVKDEMRYNAIPSVIYTDPEAASVGEAAGSARAKGLAVKEVKLPMLYSGRYVAENENGKGFIKLVVDTEKNCLIGCHMVGGCASEIIMAAAMMVDTELPPQRLKKLVFPHPTVSEMLREALFKI